MNSPQITEEPTAHVEPHVVPQDDSGAGAALVGAAVLAAGALALSGNAQATAPLAIGMSTPVQSDYDAWRFLTQATFGPTESDLDSQSSTSTARLLWTKGYGAWLEDQFNRLPTRSTFQRMKDKQDGWFRGGYSQWPAQMEHDAEACGVMLTSALWEQFLSGRDQLRQRVALALSEIFVVSMRGGLGEFVPSVAAFHDLLVKNAFGSFRTLVEDVCRSPAMGVYLTHMRNERPEFSSNYTTNPVNGARIYLETRIPDQNFARELMQLFTIGQTELNMDGTPVIDPATNQPKTTYTSADIRVLSYVFTGWARWSNGPFQDPDNPGFALPADTMLLDAGFHTDNYVRAYFSADRINPTLNKDYMIDLDHRSGGDFERARDIMYEYMRRPMAAYDRTNLHWMGVSSSDSTNIYRDNTEDNNTVRGMFWPRHAELEDYQKAFGLLQGENPKFLGQTLQIDGTCQNDMRAALNILFNHKNLAPFISKQMIQRLVTSNPSRGYVRRVAEQFKASNYSLKTLVTAILLDSEARNAEGAKTSTTFGKLREPMLRTTAILRGVNHVAQKHPVSGRPMYPMRYTHGLTANISLGHSEECAFGQGVFFAPSVFNFFRPGYVMPGSKSAEKSLVAPEFQISSGVEASAWINATLRMFYHLGFGERNELMNGGVPLVDYASAGVSPQRWHMRDWKPAGVELDFIDELTWLSQPSAPGEPTGVDKVLNRIDKMFFGGLMSTDLKNHLRTQVMQRTTPFISDSFTEEDMQLSRIVTSYFLAVISAEFVVQK